MDSFLPFIVPRFMVGCGLRVMNQIDQDGSTDWISFLSSDLMKEIRKLVQIPKTFHQNGIAEKTKKLIWV